jgi:hypothetical protein
MVDAAPIRMSDGRNRRGARFGSVAEVDTAFSGCHVRTRRGSSTHVTHAFLTPLLMSLLFEVEKPPEGGAAAKRLAFSEAVLDRARESIRQMEALLGGTKVVHDHAGAKKISAILLSFPQLS